jgi:hypothetical protein
LGDLGSAPLFVEPLFLEKVLEKMRSRAETEMTFMGMSKVPGVESPLSAQLLLNLLLRKLPDKVLEKFQIFSETLPKNIFFRGTPLI